MVTRCKTIPGGDKRFTFHQFHEARARGRESERTGTGKRENENENETREVVHLGGCDCRRRAAGAGIIGGEQREANGIPDL